MPTVLGLGVLVTHQGQNDNANSAGAWCPGDTLGKKTMPTVLGLGVLVTH